MSYDIAITLLDRTTSVNGVEIGTTNDQPRPLDVLQMALLMHEALAAGGVKRIVIEPATLEVS